LRVALSRVLHGQARIGSNLAVRLEEARRTFRAWLAMQAAHDLATERAAGTPKVRRLQPVAWRPVTPNVDAATWSTCGEVTHQARGALLTSDRQALDRRLVCWQTRLRWSTTA